MDEKSFLPDVPSQTDVGPGGMVVAHAPAANTGDPTLNLPAAQRVEPSARPSKNMSDTTSLTVDCRLPVSIGVMPEEIAFLFRAVGKLIPGLFDS